MSGGVPAGELCEQIAQIVARAYGGSLCPGMGTPGDYPTAHVDYRAANAILALLTPIPPSRDADVERVEIVAKALYEEDDPWHKAWPWPDLNPEAQGGTATADTYRRLSRAALQALGERG